MALHALRAPDGASMAASATTSVTVSAGETDAMVHATRLRIDDGFSFIKVKLGVDPDGDAIRLRRIVAAVEGRARVWVDANQGWSLLQTLHIMEYALGGRVGPAMLEQPVRSDAFDDLAHIARTIPIPVTADESARSLADIDRIAQGGAVRAINIKLMKFGGLTGAAAAARRARDHGLIVLVGSMMEHPASVAAAVRFAHGLDVGATGNSETHHAATRARPDTMATALGIGTFTDDTGNVVHDLDAAWWMAAPDPCRYDAGRVSV
jgi:L-Ala-D/L-Glu epimerase